MHRVDGLEFEGATSVDRRHDGHSTAVAVGSAGGSCCGRVHAEYVELVSIIMFYHVRNVLIGTCVPTSEQSEHRNILELIITIQ